MRIISYVFFTVLILGSLSTTGQDINNISAADLNNVNIDELSDAQIQQFLKRAQESGLTLEQLELVAKQRGMSSSQIAKLRNRIRQIQLGSSPQETSMQSPADRLRESYGGEQDDLEFLTLLNSEDTLKTDRLEIFGMDLFREVDITFEPSLNAATPESYILGAGDEVIIDVYGASEMSYQEFISPDGYILISGVGPVSLVGLTMKEAKIRIHNQLSKIYSGLKGRTPNTFLQVSLGQVRSIKVNVVGHVVQPGTYTLSSFSTAFNALYFAGGPTETGSMREIAVVRNGKTVAILDVYKYLFMGEDAENPQLLDQDVVIIRPYQNRVKLAGNVKQPAIYELKEGETLDFLLAFSGGFAEKAFKEFVTIDRVGEREKKVTTVEQAEFPKQLMQNGDSLYITAIPDRYANRVSLEGAVKRPGYYELDEGMTLSKLISQANGIREDAYLKRGNIIRLADDLTLKNITFSVSEVLEGKQDVVLSSEDRVIINSIFDLQEDKLLTINGQVRLPGDYPYIKGMTVEDLVNLSGGLKEDASISTVEVARRLTADDDLSLSSEIFKFSINGDLALNGEASDFILQPFDLVLIKSTPYVRKHKVVRIEGEVNFPGYYALATNEDKVSDIIQRAGGLTKYGYAKGASLIRRTEYYRTAFEKEELEALIEAKRIELEKTFLNSQSADFSSYDFIEKQLLEYEKELTEKFKIEESSDELEARIFRAQQLRKLLVRDSISGSDELIEQQTIGIELDKILNATGSRHDLILQDGDLISIPKKLETVRVQGEVLYPNTVRYQDRISLKKYVSYSGGFSSRAKVGKSYVVYANGAAKRTKKFLFLKFWPSIEPGADIIIPKKVAKEKIDAREIIALTSAVGTMLLVIDRLSN